MFILEKPVAIFSDTLMNILQNFVPNETITCDDKDPSWMNKELEQLIKQKTILQKFHSK